MLKKSNKIWTLTPTHTLTLAPPNKRGECQRCELEKTIWLIAETRNIENMSVAGGQTDLEYRKFCHSCSLKSVRKLETGDYPVENKEQIVKELREALQINPNKDNTELLNYYG